MSSSVVRQTPGRTRSLVRFNQGLGPWGLFFFPLALVVIASGGCAGGFTVDPSPDALRSGDYTLVGFACGPGSSGHGIDVCVVEAGAPITTEWVLAVPTGPSVTGGEVEVYYRDIHKSYAVHGPEVHIPWAEFFGAKTWSLAQDGEVEALLSVTWTDPTGLKRTTQYRGLAKILVTQPGYDRLPVDSGYIEWRQSCSVGYTTAGRSTVICR